MFLITVHDFEYWSYYRTSQVCLSISVVLITNWNRLEKKEEAVIPSQESSPTSRHHLGLSAVKANSFDVLWKPEGKTETQPGVGMQRAWNENVCSRREGDLEGGTVLIE